MIEINQTLCCPINNSVQEKIKSAKIQTSAFLVYHQEAIFHLEGGYIVSEGKGRAVPLGTLVEPEGQFLFLQVFSYDSAQKKPNLGSNMYLTHFQNGGRSQKATTT